MEFDSEVQRDETLRKLDLSTTIRGEPARRRLPLVIVKGVSKDLANEDLVSVIRKQNPSVDAAAATGPLRVRFPRSNRREDLYNAVLECSPAVRLALLDLQRVNADHQRVRVEDFTPFVQCYKCLQFGHTRAKCTSEASPCSHCGSGDHQREACPDKQDSSKVRCYNCSLDAAKHKRPESALKHSATDQKKCPRIKGVLRSIEQQTEY